MTRVLDPAGARFRLLCCSYPENPVLARHWRDIRPRCLRPRSNSQGFAQLHRHPGLRFFCNPRNLHHYRVSCIRACSIAQGFVQLEPVTSFADRFESGSKREAIDSSLNHPRTSGWKFRTRVLGQSEKCPRSNLFGFLGPKQLGLEANRDLVFWQLNQLHIRILARFSYRCTQAASACNGQSGFPHGNLCAPGS